MFYIKILCRSGNCTDSASTLSWVVTIILIGFKVVDYEDFSKVCVFFWKVTCVKCCFESINTTQRKC